MCLLQAPARQPFANHTPAVRGRQRWTRLQEKIFLYPLIFHPGRTV
jgi:hypothetical protein